MTTCRWAAQRRGALLSPFHFHRQFAAYCGVPLGRYIQLLRLKRASYRLAFAPLDKVTDIALDAGFQHGESFSRAFKQTFGLTPSQFRQHRTGPAGIAACHGPPQRGLTPCESTSFSSRRPPSPP